MTNINAFKIPTNTDKSLKFEDMPLNHSEAFGDATLVDRNEVKGASAEGAKMQKIGHIALFGKNEKLAA